MNGIPPGNERQTIAPPTGDGAAAYRARPGKKITGTLSGFLAGAVDRVLLWGLLATVLLAPVPFGSIQPWSYTLIAIIIGALLALWSTRVLISGASVTVPISRIWPAALLFTGVLAWAAFQAAPWSPIAWHNPVWAETAAVLGRPVQGFISVDPDATHTGIMRLMTYAGIFWLALQLGRSERGARLIFHAVAITGIAYAGYGIAVEITDSGTILWFEKERYLDNLTSTFRYKNAYAAYAGFGLLCTLALLIGAIGRYDYSTMGPRERARTLLTLLFERLWYLVLGVVVLVSALVLSDSRGGTIAAILAVVVLVWALWRSGTVQVPYGKAFAGGFAAVMLMYLSLSGGTVLDRLSTTSGNEVRSQIYHDTTKAIADRPLLGWGLGTFEGVFAKYKGPKIRTRTLRAHNEYLDNALGLGIPATAALVLAIGWLAVRCARGTRERSRNQIYPATGLAIIVLAGAQSAVDFTMQEPAVVATFALILGTACAQSWSNRS